MKKAVKYLLLISVLLYIKPCISAQEDATGKENHKWWNAPWRGWPEADPDAKKLPLIKVQGNKFVNEEGDKILFRGLAIADPDKLADQGQWKEELFKRVKDMGATIVRIPVHPVAWRERTPQKYIGLLDQAVEWCTGLGMYIVIDWHSIGNLHMEIFQHPMYNTTRKETYEFWRSIAVHFRGHNTVAFYELFNEPAIGRGMFGSMTWSDWKKINEDIISLIRSFDKETIPLVAGFDWAYDLSFIRYNPINAEDIGYVTHPYSMKRKPPWPPKWEENFGFAADFYPVVATEFGFRLKEGEEVKDEDYAKVIFSYLEEKGISWIGWIFDPDWHPGMFESWDNHKLTPCGIYFRDVLQGKPDK